MGTTATEVCNLSLMINGQESIVDLSENSVAAGYCNRIYDQCRKYLLKKIKPNFAIKTAELVLLPDVESSQWEFAYQVPAGCLLPLELQPEDSWVDKSQEIEFEVLGDQILTNTENPWCKYVDDCTAEKFDDMFALALSHLIAFYISTPIHRDARYSTMLFNSYRTVLGEAAVENANEGHKVNTIGQTFLRARQ
jgi:hypothetical protein